ncbi:MAG: hypothetical protein AAAC48_09930 [Phyllobacterium sp.]|uniref:hypothetical protein n=1 Tax=Phyllobacterium sp. TaxID=1871046 RepID=UPI0030F006ED
MKFRQIELGRDFDQSRLRLLQDIARKYDANQPRVPAGNSDGWQWTDGGGFASGQSKPFSVDPIKTGATSAQPRSNYDLVKPASYSGQGQHSNLEFNENQKDELRRRIGSGKGAASICVEPRKPLSPGTYNILLYWTEGSRFNLRKIRPAI